MEEENRHMRKWGPNTLLIHGNPTESSQDNSSVSGHLPPIFQTTAFKLPSVEMGRKIFTEGLKLDAYSRISNFDHRYLEERLAALENGEAAQVFGCGMGAIVTLFKTLLESKDEVIAHRNLYGGTYSELRDFERFGIKTKFVDARFPEKLFKKVTRKTRMVFLETPSNPCLDIIDFEEIKKQLVSIGREDILVVVDNTFATPYNQRPLDHGVDIVVHSLTKYLNGSGNYLGGAIVTSSAIMERIWERYGGFACIDPGVALNIANNMKSFHQRMAGHNMNGRKIATYLHRHDKIAEVLFPGLSYHRNQDVAQRLMRTRDGEPGFGGMISFGVRGDGNGTIRFLDKLEEDKNAGRGIITNCVSLGTVDTLICCPAMSTHATMSRRERLRQGITDGLIRISVGLEDVNDIAYSLERGFEEV